MASAAPSSTWQETARSKRDALIRAIPEQWRLNAEIPEVQQRRDFTGPYITQFLSKREVEITETLAADIVKQTTTGQWTAEDVIKAFAHRAALAHQLVNCLHEIFFDAAIADAKRLDAYYAEHKKPVGPLHGLPVSLKDQFHVKGVETSMGYVGWIGTFEGEKGTGREMVFESEMVRELRNLGAVLYCKTSVPHTLMCGETVNNIVGYTTNPKNRNLSSGGSSGGEGALISLRGSPLGFGTDIGGSVRIPAAFNGLFGLRPSAGRVPYEGMANSMDGQNTILSVVGPLSSSVQGIRLAIKGLLSQQPWLYDPLVVELPWRDEQERQIRDAIGGRGQLAFAVMRTDGSITPQPPVARALDIVVDSLRKRRHQVIDWKPPSHKRAVALAYASYNFDGGHDTHHALSLSGEIPAKQIFYEAPREQKNAMQIAQINVAKRAYQKEYMDYWNSTAELTRSGRPVDALIMPLAPFAAALPEKYLYYGYSVIANVLDYTSCAMPVTLADRLVDVPDKGFKPISEDDQAVHDIYDPDAYDGAHVGVQIVGRRFHEEKILILTEYISQGLTSPLQ